MRRIALLFGAVGFAALNPPYGVGLAQPPDNAIQAVAGSEKWLPGGPNLPAGVEMAVLEGDPKQEGLFTMRLRVPKGTKVPPHWHPRDERVTVIAGVVGVGFGDRHEETGTLFGAGSFYVNPADSHHYLWFPETSVIQITGEGPWELHAVPKKKK